MKDKGIKLLQFKISEEEHTKLKVEAAKRGLFIKDYILMRCIGKKD